MTNLSFVTLDDPMAAPAMAARHAPEAGYYVIRWNDTGVCQIWSTYLQYRPAQVLSKYKVVSKLVPTFVAATNIQLNMRVAQLHAVGSPKWPG